MKKHVLVFGGAGFLGSYLVEELVSRGYQTTICDVNPPHKDLADCNYLECDIMNQDKVAEAITDRIDIVYNLAGFANLDEATDNPYRTIELNVLGNINILNACISKDVERFVYASSAYAMNNKGSFYGISKLSSEKVVEEYFKKYHLPYTILRYGSVYSERSYENNYIYNLVEEAIKSGKIEHEGDGEEIREYIHAHDAAKLSVDVIETDKYENGQVVLTGVERMQRKELFLMIQEILNQDLDINLKDDGYENHYKYTPYSFEPTVSKKLVANPHIDMGQGLLRCVKAVYNEDD
ncbi:NAD-dependent epimerase/dehydratase family protein [Fodinibius sp. AD559]|uniref:NAD-dependent epimerase/dehydratase family protein n=1 Tax=Fodinibius sp. AD559 TaxID=3424179 RepID=UPI004046D037